ncbi:FAD-linked oxidoreductase [Trametes coccinea BRFM310]|uniref:Proline dehydrogenase n=1 Tax=Trametes coccinea (strain BRFM310) TaxID=1353009 RepID=A0A1Y2IX82_TRAC3|nr:FAD-linked oxidoreductase [Trametes coccinea BRFM310]
MSLARAARFFFSRSSPCRPPPWARTLATSSRAPPKAKFLTARRLTGIGLASGALLGVTVVAPFSVLYADANEPDGRARRNAQRSDTPLSGLIRTYVVYSLCSIPALVDYSPTILSTLMAIPGVKQITEIVVRYTFFDQFVGGDSAEEALPVLEQLRAENKGAILVYSVEVDEQAPGSAKPMPLSAHKQIVDETLHCIDVAADFEDKHSVTNGTKGTWVAIKLSAMVPDAESLRRLSKHLVDTRPATTPRIAFPGCPQPTDLDVLGARAPTGTLTEADIAALRALREDLRTICERARTRGIRVMVDAEHSWYQPAIDAFTVDMMREFNKLPSPPKRSWFGSRIHEQTTPTSVQPLIYNTVQGYLRRTPEYLAQSIADARAGGYSYGVKLVRGAYHPHEIEVHKAATTSRMEATAESPSGTHELSISPDNMPPVWLRKDDTDSCYNSSVQMLISLIREDVDRCAKGSPGPAIGALFGTHNWDSANLVVDELVKRGLATPDPSGGVWISDAAMQRVAVSQLYGMSDALTNHMVDRTRSTSPFVLKYLPYGSLAEVMPYLSRRAIENKSVLGDGGAASERKRAASEIMARLFGGSEA